ncbi:MAG: hypothetical protein KKC68_06315 [Candidatus Thermoplasmatota archaeon]|nr:hypothetical protein [Candidatus Thermoplasmatota archaeon]MBU1941372.1 hypothetical protein [Candidatus Thermoplasmatota archaeon]
MKKIVSLIIIALFISMGLQAGTASEDIQQIIMDHVVFNQPRFKEASTTTIQYDSADSWVSTPGKPLLPIVIQTYTYPFGTEIDSIEVTYHTIHKFVLSAPLQRAAQPLPKTNELDDNKDSIEISYDTIFPDQEFDYTISTGCVSNCIQLIVSIYLYPIQYINSEQTVLISDESQIKICTRAPAHQMIFPHTMDLLIITPDSFSDKAQSLVDHKIEQGINTSMITVEEILASYEGRDPAEQLKYCIKDQLETTGIQYVLLFGGMKGQQRDWYVPVRYAHLDDDSNFESRYLSDLYFADIYDGDGNFSDWDPDGNGVFAEWNNDAKDIIDLVPDLSVGRLPCRNTVEAQQMVNKIITYETSTYGQPWFKRIIAVGGDSAPGYIFNEGEEENKLAISYLPGFENVTLWTSDGTLTGPDDVVSAINDGCGFLFFDGHGNPSTWSTHPPDNHTWITGLDNNDMPRLMNGDKTPVTVIGGCHNGQFNVTLLNIPHDWLRMIKRFVDEEGLIKGFIEGTNRYWRSRFYYMEWVPECWAWRLTRKIGGGGVAIMAYTGLDWFAEGDYNEDGIPDCVQFFSGFANTQFFKNYGINNMTILGKAHMQTLIDYIQTFPPMMEKLDCKTVEEFTLLGDPSLQIGGYPS